MSGEAETKILSQAKAVVPLFRAPFLRAVVNNAHHAQLKEVLAITKTPERLARSVKLTDLLQFLYQFLEKHYHCEYVYKNLIANDLFLAQHDTKNALLTNEFRSGASRADTVVLNGTSTVYEIKTAYDTFAKLETQLADYRKLFDRIYIVVPAPAASKLVASLPAGVGIIGIDEHLKRTHLREAISNKRKTSPEALFDCLRGGEFKSILRKHFGLVPDVPAVQLRTVCKEMFKQLSASVAHDETIAQIKLRTRMIDPLLTRAMQAAPACLQYVFLTVPPKRSFLERLSWSMMQPAF